jgi:SAM-dependent methyltransferase
VFLRRDVVEGSGTVEEGLALLRKSRRATANSIMLADAKGAAVAETSHEWNARWSGAAAANGGGRRARDGYDGRGVSPSFRPGAFDYGRLIRGSYREGRALSPQAARTWRRVVRRYVPRVPRRLLDLGCGTGKFSGPLARWTRGAVIGVDPSAAMLRAAAKHPRVAYLRGRAEHVPLRTSSCDAAWLSQVVHHLADRAAVAAELRRVLRPGARVIVRGSFAGRLDGIPLFAYFPGARAIAESFPTLEDTRHAFETAGFGVIDIRRVRQVTCTGLKELARRASLRADSTLALLDDDEFARGQAALERDAAAEASPAPVRDPVDLLVLEAC